MTVIRVCLVKLVFSATALEDSVISFLKISYNWNVFTLIK